MARFDNAIALAQKLIAKNGQTVTLRNFGPATDSTKPWEPDGGGVTEQSALAVFLDHSQEYLGGYVSMGEAAGGTLIHTGDQVVYMPAAGLTAPPERNSQILRGSETWKVVNVKPLNPNGQQIMFELQVRQ